MNHSTAPDPHPLTRDDDTLDAHYAALERLEALELLKAPHGCMNGLVFIGHMAVDPETGEEVREEHVDTLKIAVEKKLRERLLGAD